MPLISRLTALRAMNIALLGYGLTIAYPGTTTHAVCQGCGKVDGQIKCINNEGGARGNCVVKNDSGGTPFCNIDQLC
jgi:hypothetical protein